MPSEPPAGERQVRVALAEPRELAPQLLDLAIGRPALLEEGSASGEDLRVPLAEVLVLANHPRELLLEPADARAAVDVHRVDVRGAHGVTFRAKWSGP